MRWPLRIGINPVLSICLAGIVCAAAAAQDRSTETPQPGIEELLQQLERIEAESAAGADDAPRRSDRVAVLLEQSNLATTNYYSPDGIRYFVTRAIVVNLGAEPLSVPTEEIVLTADGREFRLSGVHDELKSIGIATGREFRRFEELAAPEELQAPAGGAATTWLLYSGLPQGPQVPEMTLRVPVDEDSHEVDVNAYHRGVLGLRIERLGPERCLALMTVSGELNTINVAALADEMDRLAGAGVARVVVAWSATAAPPADQINDWLLSSRSPHQNAQQSRLPALPSSIQEFHLAGLADGRGGLMTGFRDGLVLHETPAEAVREALRTAYQVIPRDQLRREIVTGPPMTRAAALTHGAGRLPARDLPLVLRALDDPSDEVRRGAIVAVSHFGGEAAIAALRRIMRDRSHPLSAEALQALAGSRYPAARAAVQEYVRDAPPAARPEMIEVLARYPRPEWSDLVAEFSGDSGPDVRLAALQALARIGHARLGELLVQAMSDDDERIRSFAFATLAARSDPESEAAAMQHALKRLAAGPPDATVMSLLNRTRDPRALPLLLEHLEGSGEHRAAVITLLARVGGRGVADALLAQYDRLNEDEQAVALETLNELGVAEARALAAAAIHSEHHGLAGQAAKVLGSEGSAESVELLADVLRSSDRRNTWNWACNALAMIGSREARAALHEARLSDDRAKRSYAASALQRILFTSPAYGTTEQARARARQEKFDEAQAMLGLAIQFDDEFAPAYSARGYVRLQQERLEDARRDFAQAIELDPFDSLAVTGLAITLAMEGRHEEAVRRITQTAERFSEDALFAYNAACVYGTSLQQLSEPESTPDDPELLREYQVRAIEHLQRSVELGFDDWETLRSDPDLEALRHLEAYDAFLQQHGQAPDPPDATPDDSSEPVT